MQRNHSNELKWIHWIAYASFVTKHIWVVEQQKNYKPRKKLIFLKAGDVKLVETV